jgi:hypothetical protein
MQQVVFSMSERTQPKRRAPLPYYERAEPPPKMRFTPRDYEVLEAIYTYEGILADYQIQRLFFNSERRMQERMKLLWHNRYVDRLLWRQPKGKSFMVYTLFEQGIEVLASERGMMPKELGARSIMERHSLIRHDIQLNTVRITAVEDAQRLGIPVVTWVSSRSFWADHDTIRFTDSQGQPKQRGIRPDGYFVVHYQGRRIRYLLEVDMRNETHGRILDEKIHPGIAYIQSDAYKERFGLNKGWWLVVTVSQSRMETMRRRAEKVGELSKLFYFTTVEDAIRPRAFFTERIWRQPLVDEPVALFTD